MKDASNDNEPLTFTKIGLAAALVLNRLRKQAQVQNETETSEPSSETADQERDAGERQYVDRRLQDFTAFEDRASGRRKRI